MLQNSPGRIFWEVNNNTDSHSLAYAKTKNRIPRKMFSDQPLNQIAVLWRHQPETRTIKNSRAKIRHSNLPREIPCLTDTKPTH